MLQTRNNLRVLVFDPAGNYYEGKGTSGWAFYHNRKLMSVGQIKATECRSQFAYWDEHIKLIESLSPDVVVLERFILYAQTAQTAIGSSFETIQIIGIIKYECYKRHIIAWEQGADIKPRFSDFIMAHAGIIQQNETTKQFYWNGLFLSEHMRDAIRHGEYFHAFNLQKVKIQEKEDQMNVTTRVFRHDKPYTR